MIKTRQENKLVTVTEDCICNKCGNSLKVSDSGFAGLEEVTITGLYGSPVFDDMEEYSFSLCEHCLTELFVTFKIAPTHREYDDWTGRCLAGGWR
jgi:gamma-glutamylcysteine synthetase